MKLWTCSVTLGLVAAVAPLIGCGDSGSPAGPQTDTDALTGLVWGLPDLATNPPLAKARFAEGSMPRREDLKKIARYSFEPVSEPTVTGAEATIQVAVRDGGRELGQVEWTFVKDGEVWKVKSTPLPE